MPNWGTGTWGGGGVWTSLLPTTSIRLSVPYSPASLGGVAQVDQIANIVKNLANANFTQIAAQPNILGNEIDLFISNPNHLTGTLIRNMFRYPLNSKDGIVLMQSQPIAFFADWGLLDDTVYYYGWYPDNGDTPLVVAARATSYYGMAELIWDNFIPQEYKDRDANYTPAANVTTNVVSVVSARCFVVSDTTNMSLNQLIQINSDHMYVRQINRSTGEIVVSPSLPLPPDAGATVIVDGLGYPFRRFLRVFAEEFDYIHARIKATLLDRQIDTCEPQYIANLAKFVGLGKIINQGGVADTRSARNQVKAAISLWKQKGLRKAVYNLIESIIGRSYGVQMDDMKDMLMFTNGFNSYNGTLRDDKTVDTTNVLAATRYGKYGDQYRYTPDAKTDGTAVYAPNVTRVTVQIFSHFELIQGYTNTILSVINNFLPIGVNFYLLWDNTQATVSLSGSGYGTTLSSVISTQ